MERTRKRVRSFVVGPEVTGENLIGRSKEIEYLLDKIWDFKNLSIYGMARIGKSSLVAEAIRQIRENPQCVSYDRVPLFFKRTIDRNTSWKFFEDWIAEMKAYMQADVASGEVSSSTLTTFEAKAQNQIATLQSQNPSVNDEQFRQLCDMFYHATGRRIWVIMDEMDYANDAFIDCIEAFRAVLTGSQYVHTINISRDSLAVIFPKTGRGSNYPGVISDDMVLTGLSDVGLKEFRNRFVEKCPDQQDRWEELLHYGGNVPYLLAMLVNQLLQEPDGSLSDFTSRPGTEYTRAFRYWQQALYGQGLLESAFHLAEGTADGHCSELTAYGIEQNGRFTIPYFAEYLLAQRIKDVVDDELYEQYVGLLDDVCVLLREKDNCLGGSTCRFDGAVKKQVSQYGHVLEAMKTKIVCVQTLHAADTFVKCSITMEECNEFKFEIDKMLKDLKRWQ